MNAVSDFTSDGAVVTTGNGQVRGVVDTELGIRQWRGIPYGATTGGRRRFARPRPADNWDGVLDATNYGPLAPQPTYSWTDKVLGDEDCLHLDIVRPNTEANLPVVVYFHGGSFVVGSSYEPILRGENFARDIDVVYVSVNFRLGVLGYLDMRSLDEAAAAPGDAEAAETAVATPALHDQLLALRWVKENIAAFGGDPGSVTIMGESAGAAAVISLMATRAAHGLFHRAIAQSPPLAQIHSRAQSMMWTKKLVDKMALDSDAGIAQLREADFADLVRSGQSMLWRGGELLQLNSCFAPTVDGELLEAHPLTVFERGWQADVPLLIGTNADEASFAKYMYQRVSRRTRAAERILNAYDPASTDAVLKAYDGANSREEFASIVADALFWAPTIRAASAHAEKAPTWVYRFDYAPQALRWLGLGAMHTVELSAIFNQPHASRSGSLARIGGLKGFAEVSAAMQASWKAFIHNGDPGPEWPRYEVERSKRARATAVFDVDVHVEYDPSPAKRQAWQSFQMTSWGMGRPDLMEELGL